MARRDRFDMTPARAILLTLTVVALAVLAAAALVHWAACSGHLAAAVGMAVVTPLRLPRWHHTLQDAAATLMRRAGRRAMLAWQRRLVRPVQHRIMLARMAETQRQIDQYRRLLADDQRKLDALRDTLARQERAEIAARCRP